MDFSTKSLKNLVSDVTTVFTRAKQYAEETIGTAERTELDQEYETLAARADSYKQWTERIVAKLEAVVQPNPNMRYGEMLIERMGTEIKRDRLRNLEYLGNDMIDAGIAFGPNSLYGSALVKVGKHQTCLGQAEKDFVQNAYRTIIIPLRKFLDEDMKTIAKERKVLETKRLDLDAAKNRLRKAKNLESQNNPKLKPEMIDNEIQEAERDLKNCQEEFNRQIEITKLLLEGISSAQANHVRCLNDFVSCQIEYYNQCFRHIANLQHEISKPLSIQSINGNVSSSTTPITINSTNPSNTANVSSTMMQSSNAIEAVDLIYNSDFSLNKNQFGSTTSGINIINKRRARCLNDYKAQSDGELSLTANEIIIVFIDDSGSSDNEWMIGERSNDDGGGQKGKVPVAYLEILN